MAKRSQGRFIDPGKRSRTGGKRHSSRRVGGRYTENHDRDDLDLSLRPRSRSSLHRVLSRHLWVATSSLGQLMQAPFSTLMTAMVIAIALALPAGLYIVLNNVKSLSNAWQDTAQLSVFLKQSTSQDKAISLQQKIKQWKEVKSVRYISADQAMEEFRQSSGFGDVLEILKENPLPPVLVINPNLNFEQQGLLQGLAERIQQQSLVESVQLDLEWVRRLAALLDLAQRGVFLLASLLAAAILLIIGNTIRLTILNRRQEILVTKLIGGTNRFIRRPFLYTGLWYGLLGALSAWLLLGIFVASINGPVQKLAHLYQSQYAIDGLALDKGLILVCIGVGLGLVGSWIATNRHLQAIEPT